MNPETQSSDGRIIAFGEMLWDCLPSGRFPGGAPFNVAYHLRQLGQRPLVVSAVGDDAAGGELVNYVASRGVEVHAISRHASLPTGTGTAAIDGEGAASYTFLQPAAWDAIKLDAATREAASGARALVFGSLAQRSEANRAQLDELLSLLPAGAERVFDVNLRPPFDDLDLVARYAMRATFLKFNHDEAARVARMRHSGTGETEADARILAHRFGAEVVCITAAERGAGVLYHDEWFWCYGKAVDVVDTVGAGDAFLAALLRARLRRDDMAVALRSACRLGEWVASQAGATPEYPQSP
jgi:fructokinase